MRLRILVVEDDMLISLVLQNIMEHAGHEIIGTATDMAEALRAAERATADVAIMDVDLARGSNGVETAKLLRERYGVPSLFVSASLSDEVRARASPWNPVGFISKPFLDAEILKALRDVCGTA